MSYLRLRTRLPEKSISCSRYPFSILRGLFRLGCGRCVKGEVVLVPRLFVGTPKETQFEVHCPTLETMPLHCAPQATRFRSGAVCGSLERIGFERRRSITSSVGNLVEGVHK